MFLGPLSPIFGDGALQTVKKAILLCVTAAIISLAATPDFALGTDNQTGPLYQPQALNHTGTYELRQLDPNLTGLGVKFAVITRSLTYANGEPQNDYRVDTEQVCFSGKEINFHDGSEPPPQSSSHSTAIASILFGQDPNGYHPELGRFYYHGAAPDADADIYEFWHFLTNNVFTGSTPDADIVTMSIGSPFEDWWTRGIQSMAERAGLIIVAGIGNGSDVYDPVLYPAAGANLLGVGVVDSVKAKDLATQLAHFCMPYPEHSSSGPTADGRCKPDIVAPGKCIVADADTPDPYRATGDWSSFSTPIVAGSVALLIQKAKQDPDLTLAISPQGGNCVMKAILMNSATKLPYWHKGLLTKDDDHNVPLDYLQGAGLLNAASAYQHLIAGPANGNAASVPGWDNNVLDAGTNPQARYKITVTESVDKFITATVVWNKHYSSTYPFEPHPEKDANLRLELWVVDSNEPNNDYLLDYSDSNIDNVEHIYSPLDVNYNNYELVVSFSNIDDQNDTERSQRYGIAWNVTDGPDRQNIFWYDLNADGIVNSLDFTILLNNLTENRQSAEGYLLGDINMDAVIDFNDVIILLEHNTAQADWYTENTPE